MAAAVAAGGALVALLWLPARAPAPVEPLVLPAPDATSAEATSERELSPADA
jgi:hypothetical protein